MRNEQSFFDKQMNITFELNWPVIGFTYLVKTEVALSLWFFCLVGAGLGTWFRTLGIQVGRNDMWLWRGHEHGWMTHACFGAVILLGLITLWSARRAIGEAVRKAFGAGRDVDDSNEVLPHAVSVWGLVAGLAGVVIWLTWSGMDLWFACVLVAVALLGILAATRMIAEGGLVFVQFPMMVQSWLLRVIGQSTLGPANLVAMSFTGVWVGDIRVLMMPALANSTKLADHAGVKQRHLFWLFLIAIVVSIAVSSFTVLYLGYTRGGLKTDSWVFENVSRDWFQNMAQTNIPTKEQEEKGQPAGDSMYRSRTYASAVGAVFMVFLTVMRARFLWWPFHPLGFPFAIMPAMQRIWLCIFIGWLLKVVILRYGGAVLFRKLKPLFYGLILGEFVTAGLWYVFIYVYVTFFQGSGWLIYN
jgi:hypothetical protein